MKSILSLFGLAGAAMPQTSALAHRNDPALSAALGATHRPGAEYGAGFGNDPYGFGSPYGFGFGYSPYGAVPAPPPMAPMVPPAAAMAPVPPGHPMHHHGHHPHPQQMQALWAHHAQKALHEHGRKAILDPNEHSETKVEHYDFSLSTSFTIGTPLAFNIFAQPDVKFRPQRIIMNVPTVAFVTITDIKMANVSAMVGSGVSDAFSYQATAQGTRLDLPTIEPSQKATVIGTYTGLNPAPFTTGFTFPFVTTFQGPARMAG
jgi:hypothetical protein